MGGGALGAGLVEARAQSGLIATEFTYDSASRLLTDTTAGRTIRYAHDDVNNPTQLTYPSGVVIDQAFDKLDRPEVVGQQIGPDELREAVRYRYRGPFLQKRKTLGNGVDLVREFDPARRRLREVGTNPSGTRVFDEQLTWSRRNLKTSAMRGDLTRSAQVFGYDGAQRVDTTARVLLPEAQDPAIPANRRIPPEVLDEAPEQFRHVYDPAQNLVATVAVSNGVATGATMPPEPSGRNRPASVGGVDLAYDANGNLTGRGGETLAYDFRNRLTRVEGADGSLVATYSYDAFNRRVKKQVGSTTEETVWNGWQAIEDYTDGALTRRRVFGRRLDEIVLAQADVDGDGSLETEYSPLYDETGNLVALTGSGAQVFERYDYSPFGLQRTRVDARPPALGQVLLRDGRLRLEFTEPIQGDELRDAVGDGRLQLEQIFSDGTSEPVPVVIEQEVDFEIPPLELPEGLQAAAGESEPPERPGLEELVGNTVGARSTSPLDSGQGIHSRRVFLRPTQPLEEGSQVRLTVAAGAIQDRFQNQASQGIDETFSWASTGTQVVADQAPPEVRAVRLRGNRLEIEFSEEPDLATLSAIELGPATAGAEALELGTSEQPTWQLQDDSVTVVTEEPLPAGERELTIRTDLADLSGEILLASLGLLVEVPATLADVALFEADPEGVVDISTVGNRHGFHGRPLDPETGLVYFRNRYYDPEIGRFISADPLGYVDGPSMYGFAGYSPTNYGDPLGLETKEYWLTKARTLVGLDGESPQPDPITLNVRITAAYAAAYLARPDIFKWAGMAAFASENVGFGMRTGLALHKLSSRPGIGSVISNAMESELLPSGYLLYKSLATGNRAVFEDIYWQHIAFSEQGIEEMEEHYDQGNITHLAFTAWQKISQGQETYSENLIWEGNLQLLRVEQMDIVQPVVMESSPGLFSLMSVPYPPSDLGRNVSYLLPNIPPVIPGQESTFGQYSPGGDLQNFKERWAWIEDILVPAWMRYSQTMSAHGRLRFFVQRGELPLDLLVDSGPMILEPGSR